MEYYIIQCSSCTAVVPRHRFCSRCGAPTFDRDFLPDVVEAENWRDFKSGQALLDHLPEEEVLWQVTIECLADYMLCLGSSKERSQLLSSVPSTEDRIAISDVAFACVAVFRLGQTTPREIERALSDEAWRAFTPNVSTPSRLFRGLVSATANAFIGTVTAEGEFEAVKVMLVGCTLLQKAQGWESLREQGR